MVKAIKYRVHIDSITRQLAKIMRTRRSKYGEGIGNKRRRMRIKAVILQLKYRRADK